MKLRGTNKSELSSKICKIIMGVLLACSLLQITDDRIVVNAEEDSTALQETQKETKNVEEKDDQEVKESKEIEPSVMKVAEHSLYSSVDVLANWESSLVGDTYVLTKYIGGNSDVIIPSLIDGKKVALEIGGSYLLNRQFFPTSITSIKIENTGNKVTIKQENIQDLFSYKPSLTSLDLRNLDTSNIKTMSSAISNNAKLESINVSGWDTSNVTEMDGLFRENKKLSSLDISGFDTSSVTNMSRLVTDCSSLLTLNISGLNTMNVYSFSGMFAGCENLEVIDVSGFDTANATQMDEMFLNCKKVKVLDIKNFNTNKISEMASMFGGCESLTDLDMSGFTSAPAPADVLQRVRDFRNVFNGCKSLKKIDLGSFNSDKILFMKQSFANCSSVQVFDLESFVLPNLQQTSLGIKDVFTIDDPTMSELVPTIIISPGVGLQSFDKIIPGRTYGGPNYDANGGELKPGVETARYFDHFVFENRDELSVTKETVAKKYTPMKNNSNFSGWYLDKECTTPFVGDGTSIDLTTDEYMNLTLYAGWTKTITFNTKGGSNIPSIEVKEGELITQPTNPTKSGMSFAGWYSDSTVTTPWDFLKDIVNDNMTLYAGWGYNLTFIADNGTTDDIVIIKENSVASEPKKPSKEGYTFAGWYKEKGFTNKWDFKTDTVDADTKLYAKWDINKYAVTFANTTLSDETVEHGNTVGKPTDPKKEGHTFSGWYKESIYTTPWDFATDKITENTTIYAKWEVNKYTVSFDAPEVTDQTIDYGNKIMEPKNPSKEGYTFAGWYKEKGFTNKWDFKTDTVDADTKLYAKWDINKYTVTFANTTLSNETVEHGKLVGIPTEPKKEGYTFKGWYKESTYTTPWVFRTDKITENTTIYAKWESITSTLFFDAENGDSTMQQKEINYDQVYGILPTPKNGTLIFGGWFTQPFGQGTQKVSTDIVKAVDDEILYAYWLKDYYSTTGGEIRFEDGQDSRYVLQIEENSKEFVKDKKNLTGIYDIYLLLNNDRVNVENTDMWISIKLNENERNFTYYKIAYINEAGEKVEEYIPIISAEKDILTFKVSHLSYYAVYAWNDEESSPIISSTEDTPSNSELKSPVTGEKENNTPMYITLFLTSLILIGMISMKKRANTEK